MVGLPPSIKSAGSSIEHLGEEKHFEGNNVSPMNRAEFPWPRLEPLEHHTSTRHTLYKVALFLWIQSNVTDVCNKEARAFLKAGH